MKYPMDDHMDDQHARAPLGGDGSAPHERLDGLEHNDREQGAPLVLVIDDEPVNSFVLRGMLLHMGFRVLTAADGPSGRQLAAQAQPDIILLDIMMPGEDGFEVCRRLTSDPRTTDIPVIFVSSLADVDNKVTGLELGAVDYITKPFEKAEVLARVRLHLKLRLARRALIETQAAKLAELAKAQQALLTTPEDAPQARFAVRYLPALEAGGDFYDVLRVSAMAHVYFIADIAGHDLGASFVTSSLKALTRQNSGPLYTPMETMKNINQVLKTILREGRFLTAQHIFLDRGAQTLSLISAGHPPPVLLDANGQGDFIRIEGDVLGAFDAVYLQEHRRRVQPGDRIYLYTDGLVERFDPSRRRTVEDAEAALLATLKAQRDVPLEEAVENAAHAMLNDAPTEDDVVLLGIEV